MLVDIPLPHIWASKVQMQLEAPSFYALLITLSLPAVIAHRSDNFPIKQAA